MAELTEKEFTVFTTGGEKLTIKAYRMFINAGENRVYFMDANDDIIKEWVVLYSGVAAIHSREPTPTI